MTSPVRWAFLGAGFVATKGMAPALAAAEGAVLQVVAARDLERARALAPEVATTSYESACESGEVDAVYVSLPNDDHLAWVEHALAAGKHVLCEKPLALTASQVDRMSVVAAASGRLLVEAAWNRWHPRTRRAEGLAAQATGPAHVRAWFTFPGVPSDNYRLDPTRGGGALLDVGTYAVAAAHWATGAEEFTVEESSAHHGPTGVDLTTEATLVAPGARAEVTASFERPESQGMRLDADGLVLEMGDQAFTSWRAPAQLRVVEDGAERVEEFAACDPYTLMLEAMSARIRGDDAWLLPLGESRRVAATLDAIAASTPA